jgi:hypothetical protein
MLKLKSDIFVYLKLFMIIVFPKIIAKSFSALTIYPFIILKTNEDKKDYVLINHERIHLRQQVELLWIIFFIWYMIEFLIKLAYYRNAYLAYKQISFEQEAYYYENDLDYIKKRKAYHFLKFL